MEMSQELPFLGTGAPFARAKGRSTRVGPIFMRTHMDNRDDPEILAVVPLPSAEERRRREVMLARLMLVAVEQPQASSP